MPSALQQAGIEDQAFTSKTLEMTELTGMAVVRVHSMQQRESAQLPNSTGQVTNGDTDILCIRPNEWLFVSETTQAHELLEQVEESFPLQNSSVNNQTDGLALFRLTGEGAPWLLSKLSGLDFLKGRTSGPHCARTRMGHVAVVIHFHPVHGGDNVFDLVFDRSIAKYLWDLLLASAPHADDLAEAFGEAA